MSLVKSQFCVTDRMVEFLFRTDGRSKPIVMITAYVDESGTHQGSGVLVLAAYIGVSEQWKLAEERFRRANEYSGRIFHAVDCAQGGRDFRGMDKDKRNQITKKMVQILNDLDLFGVVYGAYIDDYASIWPRNEEHWETWLSQPFVLLFGGLVLELCIYMRHYCPGQTLAVVMEDSAHWYPLAAKRFLEMKKETDWADHVLLETIAPYSKEQAPQLHAPDLLAYEAYLMKLRERFPTKHPPRGSLLSLLKKRKEGRFWDKRAFEGLNAELDAGRVKFIAKK